MCILMCVCSLYGGGVNFVASHAKKCKQNPSFGATAALPSLFPVCQYTFEQINCFDSLPNPTSAIGEWFGRKCYEYMYKLAVERITNTAGATSSSRRLSAVAHFRRARANIRASIKECDRYNGFVLAEGGGHAMAGQRTLRHAAARRAKRRL